MASESKRIIINQLDFDQIKSNIKEFLKGQEKFSDYNFEGSGLAILLDVLAYNTHYNAIYNNLTINEMFIDSAVKRSSVVSRAKELGYTPNSAKSATALIQLVVNNTNTQNTFLTLPKYSPFTSSIDGSTYTFYNMEDISSEIGVSGEYVFNDVQVVEGTPLTYKFQVNPGSRYIIPNPNVDLTTLRVRVQESSTSDTFDTFVRADSIVDQERESRVYYVYEIDNGLFELKFGDGIISQPVINGNVIHIEYFVSSMGAANGARAFSYNGGTIGQNVSVVTLSPAAGGTEPESIESIRYTAPKIRTAQNRAVTSTDYKALVYANFPEISSLTSWGGEDNDPPIYGKTFICAKPEGSDRLTKKQKDDIVSMLKLRNVVSITPEILDPEYIDVLMDVIVYFNPRNTVRTARDIETEVKNTILAYNRTELSRFEGILRYSKLSRIIDLCETSIVNNTNRIKLRRSITPKYNSNAQYSIRIINPIFTDGSVENSVKSSEFYILNDNRIYFFDDDGQGKIRLMRKGANSTDPSFVANANLGTVNYQTGAITITGLNISSLAGTDLYVDITPSSNDVVSAFNQIVRINDRLLTVTAIPDETSNGDYRAGRNYNFTASRL